MNGQINPKSPESDTATDTTAARDSFARALRSGKGKAALSSLARACALRSRVAGEFGLAPDVLDRILMDLVKINGDKIAETTAEIRFAGRK